MRTLNRSILQEKIDDRIQTDLENGNLIGVAARVYQKGSLLYERKAGMTALESGKPVGDDTIFRLASMTKPITAAAVLILADRGMLKIEDLIEEYLEEYRGIQIAALNENEEVVWLGEPKTKVSIFHLLTHSSGIGSMKLGEVFARRMTADDQASLESAVKFYAGTGLAYEPFTNGAYSAVAGFDILARIVEIVSGEDYQEFLRKNIFLPCGMKDTTFTPSEEQWDRMIQMHNKKDGKVCEGQMREGCVFGDCPVTHYLGGAGLISTIEDYSRFALMLANDGVFDGKRILSSEAVKRMSTGYIYMDCPPYNQQWGLGVRVITAEDYQRLPVGAFGWSGAYGTHFWVDPVNQITAVYMKNSIYDGGSGAVTARHFEEDVAAAL